MSDRKPIKVWLAPHGRWCWLIRQWPGEQELTLDDRSGGAPTLEEATAAAMKRLGELTGEAG